MLATLSLPVSAQELRDAVRQARPFNAGRLDRVLRLDASRGLVEVQASATWTSLAGYLRAGPASMEPLWEETPVIGDSVAANAAGPDGQPAVEHVEALALVTADGELRHVSRLSNPELFRLVVGGQGLFGALYSVTLRLESLVGATTRALPAASLVLPVEATGHSKRARLLVPPDSLDAFLAEARGRCAEWRVAIQDIKVRRTRTEVETVLRWARREYAAVVLRLAEPPALGGAVRITQLRRELIDTAIAHGGSFSIATNLCATRAQAEACYPELRRFLADKRRMDPAEKLTNSWYRHYRRLLGPNFCNVSWN